MNHYRIYIILGVLVIAFSALTPLIREGQQLFLTWPNMLQIALQASVNAIIAVGMTFVIISGGIDLSVGAMVALSSVVAALVMRDYDMSPLLGFGVCLMTGMACGAFNGLLITRTGLPPFIATLGTLGMFRGLALVISDGNSIYGFNELFVNFFNSRPLDIPVAIPIALITAFLFSGVLKLTRFGKYTVAIGSSEASTRLMRIPVERYKLGIYTLSGLLAGLASAILMSRLRSGDPQFGNLFELDAIAAAVIGGTRLNGAEGTVAGSVAGAVMFSLIRNGMNILLVPGYWQDFLVGAVIVLVVMLDQWRRTQENKLFS